MSDLWTEATYDHEAQQRTLHLEMAKHASSGLWSYLALAASPEEYADRTALASDRIHAVAAEHNVPLDDLLGVFDHRFALLMEAKDNPFADESQDSSGDDSSESKDDSDKDSHDSDDDDDEDGDDSDDDEDGDSHADHNGDGHDDDSDSDEDSDDTGDGDDEDNDSDDQDSGGDGAPPWANKFSALAARINAGENPLDWSGAAPFAASPARTAAEQGGKEPSILDLMRAVDQFQQQRRDLNIKPDWKPLHKALPADEHDGWMYMGRTGQPGPFATHHYKHGITRQPLNLDEEGNSGRDLGDGRTGWGDAKRHLTDAGHYDALTQLGATPQTKYDDEYRRQRNQRLTQGGHTVIEGALHTATDANPVTDTNVPQEPDPGPDGNGTPSVPGMDGGIAETTKPRQLPEGDGTGPGMGMDGITDQFDPDLNGGDIEQGADANLPGQPDDGNSDKTAKLAAIAREVQQYNPTLPADQCRKVAQQVWDTYLSKHAEDASPLLYGDRAPVGDGPISGEIKNWSPADIKTPKPGGSGGAPTTPPMPASAPSGGAGGAGGAGELAAGEGAAADLLPLLAL